MKRTVVRSMAIGIGGNDTPVIVEPVVDGTPLTTTTLEAVTTTVAVQGDVEPQDVPAPQDSAPPAPVESDAPTPELDDEPGPEPTTTTVAAPETSTTTTTLERQPLT